ncbi:MAG: DUF58 domain-containing protein [Phycisphaerae bacterium]
MTRTLPRAAATRAAHRYGFRVTTGGILFVIGSTLIGLAAIDADINLLLMIFGLCVGSLTVNAFYGWRSLRALAIRRIVPDVAIAGQPFVIRYVVTNPRRWGAARGILIEDELDRGAPMPNPEVFLPIVPAGTSLTLTVPAASPVRGRLAFTAIKISSRFPFHLFAKSCWHQRRQEVIVFPPIGRLLADVIHGTRATDASGGGAALGNIRGDEEYYGIREYRLGDNPRRIHWRRSARTGQLMIREMSQARSAQLWCVLDTRIDPRQPDQADRLELAISAAATAVCDALERGARIGLICNGTPLVVLPPATGRARRPRLLRELAIRPQNTDDALTPHIRRLTWPARWHGPCLLFAAVENEDLRQAADALSQALGPTTRYVPGDAAFAEFFQPAGAGGDGARARKHPGASSTPRAPLVPEGVA